MKLPGQCQRVYDYMKDNGSINQWEALRDISVMRLASRISDLHTYGIETAWEWEKGVNKYGEAYKTKRYRLA